MSRRQLYSWTMPSDDGASCPIWQLPSFAAEFGDAYIGRSGLENGRLLWSAQTLGRLIARLYRKKTYLNGVFGCSDASKTIVRILRAISYAADVCLSLSQCDGKSARLLRLVTRVAENIQSLPVGRILLIPGGWNNDVGEKVDIIYIIARRYLKTSSGWISFCSSIRK